jgi:hypothetical protein
MSESMGGIIPECPGDFVGIRSSIAERLSPRAPDGLPMAGSTTSIVLRQPSPAAALAFRALYANPADEFTEPAPPEEFQIDAKRKDWEQY